VGFIGLAERAVVVTGGASGIGLATVERLLNEGARLALVDRDGEAVDTTLERLAASNLLGLVGDAADEASVRSYFLKAREHFGRIDSPHNNAGSIL
jgi:NAD(P)-dependent dehydrogenase (short-subunit alcohol dehydrogenase family)